MKKALNLIEIGVFHRDVIAQLHGEAFDEHWSRQAFQDLLSMPAAFGFLAQDHTGPLGFILCQGSQDEAEIITLATCLRARRKGVGKKLVEGAFKQVQTLFLEVAEDNESAHAFYLNLGFDQVGVRPKYYKRAQGVYKDALVMRLGA